MKKIILLSLLSIIFLGIAPNKNPNLAIPSSGRSYHSVESEIDQLVQDFMADSVAGMTVALSKGGRLVVSKGYGYANFENRILMQPYHRSRIGSVSKIITSLAIMKLTEEIPSFNLNRKVYGSSGVIPELEFSNAITDARNRFPNPSLPGWYYNIEVRHILSHTSGLVENGQTERIAEELGINTWEVSSSQLHAYMIRNYALLFEPGTQYSYSNHGMGMAGEVIVPSLSGLSYGEYVEKKIFQPLGLHDDIIDYNHEIDQHDSYPHDFRNGNIVTLPWEERPGGDYGRVSAAGGWSSSAESLVRIMVATDKLANRQDILKPETIYLMEEKPFPDISDSRAIGWAYSKHASGGVKLSHDGSIPGGRAYIAKYKAGFISAEGYDLSNINVAICANIQDISFDAIEKLASDIAKVVGRRPIPPYYDLFNVIKEREKGVCLFRPSTTEWFFDFNLNGNSEHKIRTWGRDGDIPFSGDFDGNGRPDNALFRPSTTQWFFDYNLNGDGDHRIESWGRQGDIPVAADFNGNGKDGIALFRPSTTEWFFDYNLNGDGDHRIESWGRQGDIPVAGDFNNDGKGDIGLFRPSTGGWLFDFNLNGAVDHRINRWGQRDDIPVSGDLNNDGKGDIGLFRPSTGEWLFDFNLDGQSDHRIENWGRATDIPIGLN